MFQRHLLICFGLITFLLCTSNSYSATVTAIRKNKSLVKLDEGIPSGFKKGSKVCVISDEKQIGCGKVVKSTKDYALVRFSKKTILKIKKGMEANLDGGASTNTQEIGVATGGPDHRTNIKAGYIYTVAAPSRYNKVTYNPPESANATDVSSLWKKEQDASATLWGFYGEFEFGIGKSSAMSLGLRYRSMGAFESISDYNKDITLLTKYVEIAQTGTALGLYSDFTYLDIPIARSFFWRLSSGLDIDMMNVALTAVQKSDDGDNIEIASYKSSMNIVSLRVGTHFSILIGSLGFIMPGVNVLIPLANLGGSTSSTVNDTQASMLAAGEEAGSDDLKTAVDHKKNSFGAEIFIATYIAF